MKVTERSALVQVGASTQLITAHAGLVLVRELWDRLGLPGLLDTVTVKKRRRGYSPAQAILALVETLITGGECLDDAALSKDERRRATVAFALSLVAGDRPEHACLVLTEMLAEDPLTPLSPQAIAMRANLVGAQAPSADR